MTSLFSGISLCRMILSTKTTPTSATTPIAIAIPDRATILALMPVYFIMIKVASTAIGSKLDIIMDARKLNTRTMITIITIKISCDSDDSKVPIVSLIKPVRS